MNHPKTTNSNEVTAGIPDSASIQEGDDVSLYTVGEETVIETDENGNVVKKKKFRKLRKSLSKGRRSLKNLFSPGNSKRSKLVEEDSLRSMDAGSMKSDQKEGDLASLKSSEYYLSRKNLANVDLDTDASSVDIVPVDSVRVLTPVMSNKNESGSFLFDDNNVNFNEHDDKNKVLALTANHTEVQETKDHVKFDERSSQPSNSVVCELVQIMLLIIDPLSRRFEVLQLDLDMEHAIVADLLAQVPLSVTEESLKHLSFIGTCECQSSSDSSCVQMMKKSDRLVDFDVRKGNVLIAVPEGESASDTWKNAVPILSNPRIASILNIPVIKTAQMEDNGTDEGNEIFVDETRLDQSDHIETYSSKPAFFIKGIGLIVIVFLIVLSAVIDVQMRITSPLKPGDLLEGGEWRSQCGLLRIISRAEQIFECHPMTLEFNEDGILSLYDSINENRKLMWEMRSDYDKDDTSMPTLLIADDGAVKIGGSDAYISVLNDDVNAPFTPWPFELEHYIFPNGTFHQKRRFLGIFPLP